MSRISNREEACMVLVSSRQTQGNERTHSNAEMFLEFYTTAVSSVIPDHHTLRRYTAIA